MPAAVAAVPLVGENVGPYKVSQVLGRGCFGEVFLAEDTRQPGHVVALKVASSSEQDDASAAKVKDAVLSEAELLCKLRHRHIVACEEASWDADRRLVWLALELMDGGSLRSLIDSRLNTVGKPFEAPFARRVLMEVGSALQYIHSKGVLHRDVKPANILLTLSAPPVLKLADFGISKLLQVSSRAESIVGTQFYFSPELASGKPYGSSADAWALGVCLYELAALRRPFSANNPYNLACLICEEPTPALPADTADDVVQVVTGLLEKDPGQRLPLQDALQISTAAAGPMPRGACADICEESLDALCLDDLAMPLNSLPDGEHHAPSEAFTDRSAASEEAKRNKKEKGGGSWWSNLWHGKNDGKGDAKAEAKAAAAADQPADGNDEVTLVSTFENAAPDAVGELELEDASFDEAAMNRALRVPAPLGLGEAGGGQQQGGGGKARVEVEDTLWTLPGLAPPTPGNQAAQ